MLVAAVVVEILLEVVPLEVVALVLAVEVAQTAERQLQIPVVVVAVVGKIIVILLAAPEVPAS
jgi:hypothetical protein